MIQENFKIYVDRLRDGQKTAIDENFPPQFLQIEESELQFLEPVRVQGETYIADDHLILHLDIHTSATMPCAICNESTSLLIAIKNLYIPIPLEEIKSALFDISTEVRESLLLQIPHFAECCNGKCPARAQLKKYLSEPSQKNTDIPAHEVHFPFSDL